MAVSAPFTSGAFPLAYVGRSQFFDHSSAVGMADCWSRLATFVGSAIGSAQTDYKRRYNQTLVLSDMNELLAQGIQMAVADQANLKRWNKTAIIFEQLTS